MTQDKNECDRFEKSEESTYGLNKITKEQEYGIIEIFWFPLGSSSLYLSSLCNFSIPFFIFGSALI